MPNPLSGRVSFSFCSLSCAADSPKRQNVAMMNVIKLARTNLPCLMFSSLNSFVSQLGFFSQIFRARLQFLQKFLKK
jgi:hypothetical protein